MASTKPTTTTGISTHSSSMVTVDTEPIVHTTKALSDSSVPIYCSMPTSAEMADESIIPMISIVLILRTLRDRDITKSSIAAEPIHAIPVIPKECSHEAEAKPNIGVASVKSATPRLAPEFTPKTYGPARGLRKSVCICKPLAESAIPANSATSTLGKRIRSTIITKLSSSAVPHNTDHTSLILKGVVPMSRSPMANATAPTTKATKSSDCVMLPC